MTSPPLKSSNPCHANVLILTWKHPGTLTRFLASRCPCEGTAIGKLPIQLQHSSGLSPDSPKCFCCTYYTLRHGSLTRNPKTNNATTIHLELSLQAQAYSALRPPKKTIPIPGFFSYYGEFTNAEVVYVLYRSEKFLSPIFFNYAGRM